MIRPRRRLAPFALACLALVAASGCAPAVVAAVVASSDRGCDSCEPAACYGPPVAATIPAPPPPPPDAPPVDGVAVVRALPPGASCVSVGSAVESVETKGSEWLLRGRLRRRAAALGATHVVVGRPSLDVAGGVRALGGRFLRCQPVAAAPAAPARAPAPSSPAPAPSSPVM